MFYYSDHTWNNGNTKWMGVECLQNPLDMWIMQEIIHETQPDIIIETGTWRGGSALFYATITTDTRIITVDTQEWIKPEITHPRISFFKGMSTHPLIVEAIGKEAFGKVMVILDSNHSTANVLEELKLYHKFVTPGMYLVVGDSNICGHPIPQMNTEDDGGPMKAIIEFMKENHDFQIIRSCEKYYMTFSPNGWLKKK